MTHADDLRDIGVGELVAARTGDEVVAREEQRLPVSVGAGGVVEEPMLRCGLRRASRPPRWRTAWNRACGCRRRLCLHRRDRRRRLHRTRPRQPQSAKGTSDAPAVSVLCPASSACPRFAHELAESTVTLPRPPVISSMHSHLRTFTCLLALCAAIRVLETCRTRHAATALQAQGSAHSRADDDGDGLGLSAEPAHRLDARPVEALKGDPVGLSIVHEHAGRSRTVRARRGLLQ